MLRAKMSCNSIDSSIEFVLSTDRVRAFKPSPAAYHVGEAAFGLDKREMGFAAFGGWDAVGAAWFGYKVFWANRGGAPMDTLDVPAFDTGKDFSVIMRGALAS